jgi:adenosylcobinamide-GDP ribazoletransferase
VSGVQREMEYFFGAVRFFTRIPVPTWVGHSQDKLDHAARYFPLVGALVGLIGGLVTLAAGAVLPQSIAVILGMTATILATGAFHEDGFSDTCDGFGGGWDKAQVLAIMKDSRVGSYGAVGVAMMLLAKFTALNELGLGLLLPALMAGHSVSRLGSTALIHLLHYARDETGGKAKPLANRLERSELAIAATTGLLPCLWLPWPSAALAITVAAAAAIVAGRYFVRRIGGYTGDTLGAAQQVSELAFYLGLLCSFS